MPRVAIIGASNNRNKYGNKAVRAYTDQGWDVYPVHPKEETIEGVRVYSRVSEIPVAIDRVALYLPPDKGMGVIDDIAKKNPKELFFNPGSESEELIARAQELGLQSVQACAILDIGKQPSDYPGL